MTISPPEKAQRRRKRKDKKRTDASHPQPRVRLSDFPNAFLWTIAKVAYGVLPPRVLLWCAALPGEYAYRFDKRRRRRVEQGLTAAYGTSKTRAELSRLTRSIMRYSASKPFAVNVWPALRGFQSATSIDGLQHLDDALSQGRGVILLTAHFGHSRVALPIFAGRGYPISLVTRQHSGSVYSRCGDAIRRILGVPQATKRERIITASLNLRPLLAALGRGEVVFTTGDGSATSYPVQGELFGQKKSFNGGIFSVALARNVPVLCVFVVPASGAPQVFIEPALALDASANRDEFVTTGVRRFAETLERYVRRYPNLYTYPFKVLQTGWAAADARFNKR